MQHKAVYLLFYKFTLHSTLYYSLRHCAATSLQRGQASLNTLEGGSCTVPEAVVTVLCTPDDGCG